MVIIIMGVVGAGKTTVGRLLAEKLGWEFADADHFHSAANIEKMSRGIPLDDCDRAPWLAALRRSIQGWELQGKNVVLACSALKRNYRDELRIPGVEFIYLEGNYQTISQRLGARRGHFATDSILRSQFADLEPPSQAITIEISQTPDAMVDEIITALKL
ncbi:MAG TPA: gluconokinase [Terriglobales bacterium]|nr:gluconokinase [Terriglobales bacterium]